MCEIEEKLTALVKALHRGVPTAPEKPHWTGLRDYALLVLATNTPVDRAIVYLKDTGSPAQAKGRLLLRAAEHALRAAGDVERGAEA